MTKHRWLSLSQTDPRPLYLQVIEQIKRGVAIGDLAPGAEIPSIRQLAADLEISVITVKRAYLELEREGVIVTRQGRGSAIADDVDLSQGPQTDELTELLARAAELGSWMGLSRAELTRRLAAECDSLAKRKS